MGGSLTVSRSFRSWSSSRCRLPARSSAASACSCRLRIFLRTASSELLPAMARRRLRLSSAAATAAAAEPRSGSSRPGRLCSTGAPCGPGAARKSRPPGRTRERRAGAQAQGTGAAGRRGAADPGNWLPLEPLRVRAGIAGSRLPSLEGGCRRRAFASNAQRLKWPQVEDLDDKVCGDSCWPLRAP